MIYLKVIDAVKHETRIVEYPDADYRKAQRYIYKLNHSKSIPMAVISFEADDPEITEKLYII